MKNPCSSPKKKISSYTKSRGSSPHHKKQYVNILTNTNTKIRHRAISAKNSK
jgi:hypothetical protein